MRFYQYIHLSSLHPAHLLQCSCPSHIININTWHFPVLFSSSCEWWAQLWLRPLSPMPWWLTLSLCAPVSMFYFLSVFLHMSSEHHVTLTTGVYHSCFKKKKKKAPSTNICVRNLSCIWITESVNAVLYLRSVCRVDWTTDHCLNPHHKFRKLFDRNSCHNQSTSSTSE